MANLLQIHEPGQTPLPHTAGSAVGIDLGTTHSVVAIARDGNVEVLADAAGAAMIPSVVRYGEDVVQVGHAARDAYRTGESGVVASIKRFMGKAASELGALAGQITHEIDAIKSDTVRLQVGKHSLTPVEISADILRHMKTIAEEALGHEVTQAVITVPAYFDDAARTATKQAAQLAGLEVLRLLNEPTAAALAYGLDSQAQGIFAIYDFGGGTFDISILKLQEGVFQVLATAGDTQLGGDDIDHIIAEQVLAHAGMARATLPQEAWGELLSISRAAKEQLSQEALATITWHDVIFPLNLPTLERIAEPLLARTLACCDGALRDAGLTPQSIAGVVLVGGSTRMPQVKQQVAEFFGKPALDTMDPDLVVAMGAALQAEALTQGSDNLLLDVIPLSLGLETMGGIVEKIMERNAPIPAAMAQEFTTYQDGQTAMVIHVVQGERELAADCRSLATFTLRGIPPMVAGAARVRIHFSVDADGLLTVAAKELNSGVTQQVEVKPSYGLAFDEIERMLHASMEHARGDMTARLLIEARVDAQRVIGDVGSAIAADGALLKPGEEGMIRAQMRRLEDAIAGVNRERIDHESHQLNAMVASFAQRRMDAAIGTALAGKTVNEVNETN